jgi:hypothetical protein
MSVVIEAARMRHRFLKRILAGMAERGMADIVGEAERLGEVFVETQSAGDRPTDLSDFETVSQPDAEMVAIRRDEDLGFMAETAEWDEVYDSVAVALEGVAGAAVAGRLLRVEPAARSRRIGGVRRERPHRAGSFSIAWPASLVQA